MRIERTRDTYAQETYRFSVHWLGKLTQQERAGFLTWFFAEYRDRLPARHAGGDAIEDPHHPDFQTVWPLVAEALTVYGLDQLVAAGQATVILQPTPAGGLSPLYRIDHGPTVGQVPKVDSLA